jgi:hypothetical protein
MTEQLTTPLMAEVLPGTNLQDGRVRFFMRHKVAPKPLGTEMTFTEARQIAPGGRKQMLPAGTVVRMCGREAITDLDESMYDTRVVVTGWRTLWEVVR